MATFRTSAAGGSSSGTSNRTATLVPAVGDLWIVYCYVAANTNDTPTCSDNNSGTYTLVDVANCVTGGINYRLSVFVRTALHVNTTSTVVTVATGSNTSGCVHIIAYSGITRVNSAAIRSKGLQNNQAAGTAAPVLNQSALTGNPTLVAQGSGDSTTTPPTSWTEAQDNTFSNDTVALESAWRDSGFTGTTITFGAASSTTFCSHALELDTSAMAYTLSTTTGAFTLTGNAAGFDRGLPVSAGTFTLTGNAATLTYTPASPITLAASANIAASGEATTAQLTPPSGKTTGDFIAGRIQDDENPTDSVDLGTNQYTELEWSIQFSSAANGAYEFRVTVNGTPLSSYSITPQLAVGYVLSTTTGVFSLTGNTASSNRTMPAATGVFTLTGNDAGLFIPVGFASPFASIFGKAGSVASNAYTLTTTTGVFTETGNAANLLFGRKVSAITGTFTETGNSANLLFGRTVLTSTGTFTLTGTATGLTAQKKLSVTTGIFTETGNTVNFLKGRTLVTTTGTFSLTGNAATFLWAHRITTATGVFTLTGNAATLTKTSARTLIADTGVFSLTGNTANLLHGYKTSVTTGVFTETGQSANLLKGSRLTTAVGSFTLTGNAATLTKTTARTLLAQTGAFSLTGNATTFRRTRIMPAQSASFSLTGNAANLNQGYLVAAQTGSFSLTGITTGFRRTRVMPVSTGSFLLTGTDTRLGGSRILTAATGPFTLTGINVNLLFGLAAVPIVGPLNVSLTNSGNLATTISLGNLVTTSTTVSDGTLQVDV